MKEKILRLKQKASDYYFKVLALGTTMAFAVSQKAFAEGGSSAIDTKTVETVTERIKDATTQLAMPIGSLLIFICVVLTAIKIAINHNNPKERSENLASIGWLVIAGLILGCSLLIAGLILKITTNNGQLFQ